jgi:Sigma-70 region 2
MPEDRQRLHLAENSLAQMATADDSDLLQSAKEGDAAAFDTLIRRHDRFLYRVARNVLLDDYEAEDVVQETFIKKLLERAIDGLCCRQSPQNEACRQEASARSARKRWRALLCVVREGAAELALS